jgi:hypothetical protein
MEKNNLTQRRKERKINQLPGSYFFSLKVAVFLYALCAFARKLALLSYFVPELDYHRAANNYHQPDPRRIWYAFPEHEPSKKYTYYRKDCDVDPE